MLSVVFCEHLSWEHLDTIGLHSPWQNQRRSELNFEARAMCLFIRQINKGLFFREQGANESISPSQTHSYEDCLKCVVAYLPVPRNLRIQGHQVEWGEWASW